ncbi:putative lipoprotein, partial [Vibrio parahaemolyticus V-223/04]
QLSSTLLLCSSTQHQIKHSWLIYLQRFKWAQMQQQKSVNKR